MGRIKVRKYSDKAFPEDVVTSFPYRRMSDTPQLLARLLKTHVQSKAEAPRFSVYSCDKARPAVIQGTFDFHFVQHRNGLLTSRRELLTSMAIAIVTKFCADLGVRLKR